MGTVEDLLDERFVPIDGYPRYEVSNYGRVARTSDGFEMKIQTDHNGQRYVALWNDGEHKKISIRRLVAQAFFSDYESWMDVYLISDNKNDCSVRNITLQDPVKKKKIRIIETGEVFTNTSKVAMRIGGSASVIAKVLMGMGKSHKGYTFEWVESEE